MSMESSQIFTEPAYGSPPPEGLLPIPDAEYEPYLDEPELDEFISDDELRETELLYIRLATGKGIFVQQDELDYVTCNGLTIGSEVRDGQIVRTGEDGNAYNCHGYVFTRTEWLNQDEVEEALINGGYTQICGGTVQPGDLAIYHDEDGDISHTGIVRVVCGGRVDVIEGKWAGYGRYLHRPGDVPFSYGRTPRYYSSDRPDRDQLYFKFWLAQSQGVA